MLKSVIGLAAAAALLPLAAAAETTTPITVKISYDKALLASDAGAEMVLESMRAQAAEACTHPGYAGKAPRLDRKCAKDVVAKAATKILLKQQELGLETAPAFARVARIQTADLGQR
ncbi:MAG: UrcA family protein [Hyphomonas sp.]|nr:UrcA family protein [Hyphomonas sp.]